MGNAKVEMAHWVVLHAVIDGNAVSGVTSCSETAICMTASDSMNVDIRIWTLRTVPGDENHCQSLKALHWVTGVIGCRRGPGDLLSP